MSTEQNKAVVRRFIEQILKLNPFAWSGMEFDDHFDGHFILSFRPYA